MLHSLHMSLTRCKIVRVSVGARLTCHSESPDLSGDEESLFGCVNGFSPFSPDFIGIWPRFTCQLIERGVGRPPATRLVLSLEGKAASPDFCRDSRPAWSARQRQLPL